MKVVTKKLDPETGCIHEVLESNQLKPKVSNLKKCIISRYDETITKPPYLTIPIDKVEVEKPENDEGGVEFAERLIAACRMKGYIFRFYVIRPKKEEDYEIVVY
jgi:hypothetical protein